MMRLTFLVALLALASAAYNPATGSTPGAPSQTAPETATVPALSGGPCADTVTHVCGITGGKPEDECARFGLAALKKDDYAQSVASTSAQITLVKAGLCYSVYRCREQGTPLVTMDGKTISHVTYCGAYNVETCPCKSETTAAPTTEAPTTAAPTTQAPTTEAPTTAAPTTQAPTTDSPTTAAPTTQAPTTEAPTTAAPTTQAPTTEAPTTAAPTTQAPTTEAPTTAAPTTQAPTTEAPTTAAPTTQAPTTVAPSTAAPTTATPTTLPPIDPALAKVITTVATHFNDSVVVCNARPLEVIREELLCLGKQIAALASAVAKTKVAPAKLAAKLTPYQENVINKPRVERAATNPDGSLTTDSIGAIVAGSIVGAALLAGVIVAFSVVRKRKQAGLLDASNTTPLLEQKGWQVQ